MSHNCGHSAMKGIWLWADMVVVVAVSGEHVGGGDYLGGGCVFRKQREYRVERVSVTNDSVFESNDNVRYSVMRVDSSVRMILLLRN